MAKITDEYKATWHFETKQGHIGQEEPDPATDARAVPIYQTTSYVFRNSDHGEARFGLKDAGNIYGRLTNPTEGVFEARIAALENGTGALAVGSGAAAVTYAFQAVAHAGDHIVSAKNIYGGTYNYLKHTFPDYGVTTTFVDPFDLKAAEAAIQPNTKALYVETLGNPNSEVIDIEGWAKLAHSHGLPLIVDNTFATPYLLRPIEYGADIVVHSATKFIGGHGTTLGGVIVDGNFDWTQSDRWPWLTEPNPSYLPASAGHRDAVAPRRAACGECAEGRRLSGEESACRFGQSPGRLEGSVAAGSLQEVLSERRRLDLHVRHRRRRAHREGFHRQSAAVLTPCERGGRQVPGDSSGFHDAQRVQRGGAAGAGHPSEHDPSVDRNRAYR